MTFPTIKAEFDHYVALWNSQSMNMSYINVKNENYIHIVDMGWKVVPIVLNYLSKECFPFIFVALTDISGEKPFPPEKAGRVRAITKCYLAWGRHHGYLAPYRKSRNPVLSQFPSTKKEVDKRIELWRDENLGMSIHKYDGKFKDIVEMGWKVVPILLNNVKEMKNASVSLSAIIGITHQQIVKKQSFGNSEACFSDCLAWGQEQGIII